VTSWEINWYDSTRANPNMHRHGWGDTPRGDVRKRAALQAPDRADRLRRARLVVVAAGYNQSCDGAAFIRSSTVSGRTAGG
jgi:hypothetical protein